MPWHRPILREVWGGNPFQAILGGAWLDYVHIWPIPIFGTGRYCEWYREETQEPLSSYSRRRAARLHTYMAHPNEGINLPYILKRLLVLTSAIDTGRHGVTAY